MPQEFDELARKLVSGNRSGRPWSAVERAVAVLMMAFGVVFVISVSVSELPDRLANLAGGFSFFGLASCMVHLSVKHPEIRSGFRVGRRR